MKTRLRWARVLVVLTIAVAVLAAACAEETVDRPVSATGSTLPDGGGIGAGAALGLETFNTTCQACHAAGGIGVTGLGPALVDNVFLQGLTDDEVVAFITVGRDPSHPDNTTGIGMPAKGGNPSLTVDDLQSVVLYLRTLQE